MDFARKILEKYGWKDGDGLGKTNSGISKALRANLKFDKSGFGVDLAATDFNNHWWERVFNDAANNVDIKQDGESITVDLKNEADGVEITTKGYSVKKLKKAKGNSESYNNFIQSATVTSRGAEIEKDNRPEASEIEIPMVNVLTDEELFKACGGRTAHKGARHGLKLSGKLARIEQQEKELLAKMMAAKSSKAEEGFSTEDKKNKTSKLEVTNAADDELPEKQEKKKKKRKQKNEKESMDFGTIKEDTPPRPKKKKKHKLENPGEDIENISVSAEPEEISSENPKKRKKHKEGSDENPTEIEVKHKKKKKHKRVDATEDTGTQELQTENMYKAEEQEDTEISAEKLVSKKKKSKKKSKICEE